MSIDRQALFDQIYAPIFASAGSRGRAAQLRPDRPGPVLPAGQLPGHLRPGGGRDAADRGRLGEGRRRLLGQGRRGARRSAGWSTPATPGGRTPRRTSSRCSPRPASTSCRQRHGRGGLPAAPAGAGLRHGDVHLDRTAGPDVPDAVVHLRPDPDGGEQLPGSEPAGLVQRGGLGGAARGRRRGRRGGSRRSSSSRPCRRRTTDNVLLPLVNYPKSGIWRTDKVGGPVGARTANYRAFNNFPQWEDVDGDGQIVIGAEQWPAASTRSPSAPTRRGTCGRWRSRSCRRSGTATARADLRDHQPGDRGADRRELAE